MTGCKKDDQPQPAIPLSGNFAIINGIGFQLNQGSDARYWTAENVTHVTCQNDYGDLFTITLQDTTSGSTFIHGNNGNVIAVFVADSVSYSYPSIQIDLIEYGPVGGYIRGSFTGTAKLFNDTSIVVSVSGNFEVVRGQDI